MNGLTTALLGRACHTFLTLAYPGGEKTIPAKKRAYLNIPPDGPLSAYLPPAPAAAEVCQTLCAAGGRLRGYAFRLGSAAFPHLKLQVTDHNNGSACVFAVDTHDALTLPPSHPDAEGWTRLQVANRQLKERIEHAWEQEGLLTFNGLLREDLEKARPTA